MRIATTSIIRLNTFWLLLIVIIPFTTRTLSVGQPNLLRFGLYAATQSVQFTIFALMTVVILRSQHVPAGTDVQRLHLGLWQTVAVAVGFGVSILLYPLIGQWAFAVWAVTPILSNLIQGILATPTVESEDHVATFSRLPMILLRVAMNVATSSALSP